MMKYNKLWILTFLLLEANSNASYIPNSQAFYTQTFLAQPHVLIPLTEHQRLINQNQLLQNETYRMSGLIRSLQEENDSLKETNRELVLNTSKRLSFQQNENAALLQQVAILRAELNACRKTKKEEKELKDLW